MSTATKITLTDLDRMIAEGLFDGKLAHPRVELIKGELREMKPVGPPHDMAVVILTEWSLKTLPPEKTWVRIKCSIAIAERDSAPEPDVASVARKDYRPGRPAHPDVLLVIEIADSSLKYDRGEKADLYASAGIEDYWVVNIPGRCVEVFRQPEEGRYLSHEVVKAPGTVRVLAFPEAELPVELLFPSEKG